MKLARVIYILLALVIVGLLCYQGFVTKELNSSGLIRAILLLIAAVIGFLRTFRRNVANKKSTYRNAYGKHIGDAFDDDPKLEKQLYQAIDDFNKDAYSAGIRKLEKLDQQCTRSAQRFTVQFFMALCYEGQNNYRSAIESYRKALTMRQDSSAASNLGMCYTKIGDFSNAVEYYQLASRLDSKNPFPLNNLAQLYLRNGDYEEVIPYAMQAIQLDGNFRQANEALTVAYAMLDDPQQYEHYYRRSITCGSDGNKLKAFIRSLQDSN